MNQMTKSLAISLAVASLTAGMWAQLTVDATVPIRARHRLSSGTRGGGVGLKVPLRVAIETNGSPPHDNGKMLVTFILTNTGTTSLEIPISPHPGDFEPSNAAEGYTVRTLYMAITTGKVPGTIIAATVLYGSRKFPNTLVVLAPGRLIRVLTRIPILPPATDPKDSIVTASVILGTDVVEVTDGRSFVEMEEIGSANSPEYTRQAFLGHSE
jgi:hypothetical protein